MVTKKMAWLAMVAMVAGGVFFSRIGGPGWSGPRSMRETRTIRAVIVTTDAEAMRRHEVSTGAGARWWRMVESKDVSLARIETLEDRALVEALAAMGRPTGIVRSMGKVWLTRPVLDEQGPWGG